MREALARWSAPLLALLPDPRRAPVRRQASVAIMISALVHVVIFFIAVGFLALAPERIGFVRAKPVVQPLEVVVVPPEPEPQQIFTLNPNERIEYLDSSGLAKADAAPDKPRFESDQDMAAASERPALGDAPVPSMDGRTDREFMNFKTQHALIGPKVEPFPTDVSLATAAPPPVPIFKPTPYRPEQQQPPEPQRPEKMADEQSAPPPPEKPQPIPQVERARDDQIAFAPAKAETPPALPVRPQPSAELAKLIPPAPPPRPQTKASYQPQLEQTKIEGSISNRGKASVDAVRTPLGVFKKQISEAIGSRWLFYVKQRMDIVTTGVARVSFYVTRDGRIQDVRVVENTSNESFAQLCEQSVREAEFGSAPQDAFDAMLDGRLPITFTFNLYPN